MNAVVTRGYKFLRRLLVTMGYGVQTDTVPVTGRHVLFTVPEEDRVFLVPAENRSFVIPVQNRTYIVKSEH